MIVSGSVRETRQEQSGGGREERERRVARKTGGEPRPSLLLPRPLPSDPNKNPTKKSKVKVIEREGRDRENINDLKIVILN